MRRGVGGGEARAETWRKVHHTGSEYSIRLSAILGLLRSLPAAVRPFTRRGFACRWLPGDGEHSALSALLHGQWHAHARHPGSDLPRPPHRLEGFREAISGNRDKAVRTAIAGAVR